MGKLIWIASYPKSGNTWVRFFLNTILINQDQPLSINEIKRLTILDTNPYFYEKASGKKFPDIKFSELSRYRPLAHHEMTKIHPNPVIVKTHSVLGDHMGVPFITPEVTAAAVYLVRNPLDIVASFANHKMLSTDEVIKRMCNETWTLGKVASYVSSWSTNVKSWTVKPHPKLLVMRYEDLLDKPEESFTQLVKFLGIERSEEDIARAIRFTSIGELQKQEASEGFNERADAEGRFFRKGRAGGWREELSEKQAGQLIDYHREQMQRFGYLPDGF